MILHDIIYMQKLYTYNLTIKTSIYSKPSPLMPCSNHRTASWRPSLVRKGWPPKGLPFLGLTDTRKKHQKNIIQHHQASSNIIQHHPTSSSIIQHHPTSSDIIQHHPTSQQTPAVLHQRGFPWPCLWIPVAFASLLRSQ